MCGKASFTKRLWRSQGQFRKAFVAFASAIFILSSASRPSTVCSPFIPAVQTGHCPSATIYIYISTRLAFRSTQRLWNAKTHDHVANEFTEPYREGDWVQDVADMFENSRYPKNLIHITYSCAKDGQNILIVRQGRTRVRGLWCEHGSQALATEEVKGRYINS